MYIQMQLLARTATSTVPFEVRLAKGWAGLLKPRRTDCNFCFGKKRVGGSRPTKDGSRYIRLGHA